MSWPRFCGVVGYLLVLIASGSAQDSEPDQVDLKQEFFAAATKINIQGGATGAEPFALLTKPVLSWSNPERRTAAGATYLWTLNARPQVALCLYPIAGDQFDSELQSLSLHPLTARVDGQVIWEPPAPGIEFAPLTTNAPVAKTVPARLLQMRNLAREFSAKLVPPARTIPLRLLPTPIYRYSNPDASQKWIEGAVFAIVQATDPEVLVVIEAIETEEKELAWQFAVARMSMVPTELRLRDEVIWQTQWAIKNRSTPYFVYKNN